MTTVPTPVPYHSTRQAAQRCGLSEHLLHSAVRRGVLPEPARDAISGHFRWSDADISRIREVYADRRVTRKPGVADAVAVA